MKRIKVLIQSYTACFLLLFYCCNLQAQSGSSASLGGGCYNINGLYVSLDVNERSARPILGRAAEENILLTYLRDNGVNYLICYELQQILPASAKATQLAAFIKKAKTQYGIQQIGAALGTGSQANLVVAYNNSHAADERIDVLNLEDEFWGRADRAAAFNSTMTSLRTFAGLAAANNLETEIYVGHILENEGIQLANTVDRVLVHFYRSTDVNIIDYNSARLQYLGSGSRKVRVAPIFSGETPENKGDEIPFMGTWLKTHPQDQAIKSWLAGYNALTGAWKSNVEIMGATWFSYDVLINPNGNSVYVIPSRHITTHPQSQTVCNGQSVSLSVASSASVKSYYWMKNGRCLSDAATISGSKSNVLTISNFNAADAGSYHCRVVSYDAGNPSSCSSNAAVLALNSNCNTDTQSPYNGIAAAIPGTIEAENYDTGGQGIAYNDGTTANQGSAYRADAVDVETTTGGYNVGYITSGEWLEYTVDVTAGTYQLEAVVAAISAGKTLQLQLDGTVIANMNIPNTGGWAIWQKITVANVTLTAGRKVLRLQATSSDFNVDRLIFTKTIVNQPPVVTLTSPLAAASYTAPASIMLAANASDSDGSITKVEFYRGTVLLGTDVNSPYSYTWTNVGEGSYSLSAKAYDNTGLTAVSAVTAITVSSVVGNNLCSGIPPYAENVGYTAGSKVQEAGNSYECKPWPYSGWCNGAAWAYKPGSGAYWPDAWTLSGSCAQSSLKLSAIENESKLSNSPNPFSNSTTIEVKVEEEGIASVKVYDKSGKEVAVLVDGYLSAGIHRFEWNSSQQPDVYVIRYQNNQQLITRKMIKLQ